MNIVQCQSDRRGTPNARRAPESGIDWAARVPGLTMEFTILFLAIAIVMLVAWRGPRRLAMGLFAFVLVACVATYLHHATDVLKLSF
jgi:hypothetical protein